MQRSKRQCEVETAFGFGRRYGTRRNRLTGNCDGCKSTAELVTASARYSQEYWAKAEGWKQHGSDVMSGKQIVGRKDGASRDTAYMIADGL